MMFRKSIIVVQVISSLAIGAATAFAQSTESDYKAAYMSAIAANKKAGKLRNQWTRTELSLLAAQKAAAAGDFSQAAQLSKEAEALANASIAQSVRENTLWKESEVQ